MQPLYLAFFYLIGSIPVAWLMGRLAGRGDIRRQGSGNAGVMNVALNVSRGAAILVMAVETAKGVITVLLAQYWQLSEVMIGLSVVAAVAGTCWPIWLKGRGGRGNTLGVAAMLVLAWPAVLIELAVWIIARLLTHSSFWATRVWLVSLPVTLGLVTQSWSYALMGALLALLYFSAHKTATDDHTILKEKWPSLWAFITAPPRHREPERKETGESLPRTDVQEVKNG
jgi:glycerol-3-phosphate acyltransferase PlsY